jgi:hypothetical protein
MHRTNPTQNNILQICSENKDLISNFYYGLLETPSLQLFYPHLDLDELAAFASSSWSGRNARDGRTKAKDVYELFEKVFKYNLWGIRDQKDLSNLEKDRELNPFQGKCLNDRLEQINPNAVNALFEQLKQPTKIYITEGQHRRFKPRGQFDHLRHVVLPHPIQAYVGKANPQKVIENYATLVMRTMKQYSNEVHELSRPEKQQALF